jgi:NTE family protein
MHRIQDFDGLGWLARRFLNPLTWLTLQFEDQTRVAVQQQMIEDLLQTKATMAALNQPGRHLTLLNATDMVAGQVFTFDRQTLDDVCMDYDKVPVSLAVNASADVPFAFTPCCCTTILSVAELPWTAEPRPALPHDGRARAALMRTWRPTGPRYRQSLRNEVVVEQGTGDKVPPYRKPVYLRLVDGGVADNSGRLRCVARCRRWRRPTSAASPRRASFVASSSSR